LICLFLLAFRQGKSHAISLRLFPLFFPTSIAFHQAPLPRPFGFLLPPPLRGVFFPLCSLLSARTDHRSNPMEYPVVFFCNLANIEVETRIPLLTPVWTFARIGNFGCAPELSYFFFVALTIRSAPSTCCLPLLAWMLPSEGVREGRFLAPLPPLCSSEEDRLFLPGSLFSGPLLPFAFGR